MLPRRPRVYYKTLASLSRVALLHELQARGALTISQLAAATGLHPNTAREHLRRLMVTGLVRADPILRGGRGRPELAYRHTTGAQPVRQDAAPERRQLEALGEHMSMCGFDASIDAGGARMTMRACPFAALSEQSRQVCEVHRALIADVLDDAAGPLRAGELRRLPRPGECELMLERDAPSTPSTTTSSV